MKELLAAAHEQGDAHPEDNDIIREVGGIQDLAHGQPGQLLHEQDARLATPELLLPLGDSRVEEILEEHPVQ